jgi:hypothetical protein
MNLVLLAVLGVVEAVVWLWRMRTHRHESALVSGLAAGAVTCTRLVFVYVGATAVMAAVPVWAALAAYVLPASIATAVAHWWADRSGARPCDSGTGGNEDSGHGKSAASDSGCCRCSSSSRSACCCGAFGVGAGRATGDSSGTDQNEGPRRWMGKGGAADE